MKAKRNTGKKPARKKETGARGGRRKAGDSRKRLRPRKEKRGLGPGEVGLDLEEPEAASLAAGVEAAGGTALAAYREPLSGRAVVLAVLPLRSVEPTPFQRDLSPVHVKRLAAKIEESGAFLDPLIVVCGPGERFWTPNGRHRLAAAKVLGLEVVTALVSGDETLAYRILALNTEKAHNLRDRSLEVIRMAKDLARRRPRAKETEYAEEFEAPEFLTLGLAYETDKRFPGSAYRPVLRKVDRFASGTLSASLRKRTDLAARLAEIEVRVKEIVSMLQARGLKSPYLRSYVVARINPVRFHRASKKKDAPPPMTPAAALTRMAAAAKRFDPDSVNPRELALLAAALPGEEE